MAYQKAQTTQQNPISPPLFERSSSEGSYKSHSTQKSGSTGSDLRRHCLTSSHSRVQEHFLRLLRDYVYLPSGPGDGCDWTQGHHSGERNGSKDNSKRKGRGEVRRCSQLKGCCLLSDLRSGAAGLTEHEHRKPPSWKIAHSIA